MTAVTQLQRFTLTVGQKRHDNAIRCLIEILEHLAQLPGNENELKEPNGVIDGWKVEQYCTKLVEVLTPLFTDPSFAFRDQDFYRLSHYRQELTAIFTLSDYRHPDHLLRLLTDPEQIRDEHPFTRFTNKTQTLKFLTFYALDSQISVNFRELFAEHPDPMIYLYLGLLCSPSLLSTSLFAARQKLLQEGDMIVHAHLFNAALLSAAWMFCSYDDHEQKHVVKQHLNRLIQKWLIHNGISNTLLTLQRQRKDRPTMLVVAERLQSMHAVFRCYASFLRQLRTRFHLELVVDRRFADDVATSLFDEVILFNPQTGIGSFIQQIVQRRPDLVYYPSLGMHFYSLLLANLRISPIQFATLGHPATSGSPYIDYIVLGHQILSDPRVFTETLITLRSPGNIYENHPRDVLVTPEIRTNPNPLRVCVVSKSMKLNPRFMALCQRLVKKSKRPIEFHFFLGAIGLRYLACRHQIRDWFPHARVYPMMDFRSYILRLTQMDIRLGTFPFGGTATTIDCLRQAIPMITLQGDQPHARLDAMVMRLIGMPEWLITKNELEYEEAALRLIQNDEQRISIAAQMQHANVDHILFQEQNERYPTDFVDTIWWLYENHEMIQKDGRKVWTCADRTPALPVMARSPL